jgi:hypothetical protein
MIKNKMNDNNEIKDDVESPIKVRGKKISAAFST